MPTPSFEFNSSATAEGYFTVVSFKASEGLSRLYRYEIELKAPVSAAPGMTFLDDVLDGDAEFITTYDNVAYPVYGLLAEFNELQTSANYTYYRAVLVPRLWKLTLNRNSKVYTDPDTSATATGLTVLDILEPVLDNYSLDYIIGDITGNLLHKVYRCQFNESDFKFISRLLENEGIFYYFDHSEGVDKIVFSNGPAGGNFAASSSITFDANPPPNRVYDSVSAWACRKQRLPGNVILESYDPSNPSDDVSASYPVDSGNFEDQYSYGENIDLDEAPDIARIRAEKLIVNNTVYHGESGLCALRAGYSFSLNSHLNTRYNDIAAYIVTEVNHEGQSLDIQASAGGSGIQAQLGGQTAARPQYTNSFTAINSDIQFRPPRSTPRPRFYGTISAFVYSADGSAGEYAYVNEYGQYRVTLPFRRFSDAETDRATWWIRMAQPYHGVRTVDSVAVPEGMFYPLMHGTEVLLTFINGDPDRPIISAALPNESAPSLVTTTNSNQTVFSTHGMLVEEVHGGIRRLTEAKGWSKVEPDFYFKQLTASSDAGKVYEVSEDPLDMNDGMNRISMQYGNQYNYIEGNIYTWGADYMISFGNDYEEVHEKGESNDEYFYMTDRMRALGTSLSGTDYSGWTDGEDGLVEKNWGDKCEYHEGRAFNWSGGRGPGSSLQTFNYGNGYTENLLEVTQGTSVDLSALDKLHADTYTGYSQIDPAKSTIEKTFGATYSYQNGFSLDVKVGNSVSKVYGDSDDTINGNQKEFITGASASTVIGARSEIFTGAKSETNVSGSTSQCFGVAQELFIGGKAENSLAWCNEFMLGFQTGITMAGFLKFTGGFGIDRTVARINQEDVTLKDTHAKIVAHAIGCAREGSSIKAQSFGILNAALKIIA
jgi:type VI secretion system VgrG family protein